MNSDIEAYNERLADDQSEICSHLSKIISNELSDAVNKIWHGHPVWFLNGNPIVGYSKQKPGIRLMFWSGADFDEDALDVKGKKFKDASIFYNDVSTINTDDIKRWLNKSKIIQWDYKNIVKRKGQLEKLNTQLH